MSHPCPALPDELAPSPIATADRRPVRRGGDRRDRPGRTAADRRNRPHLGGRGGEPEAPRLLGRDRRAVAARSAPARTLRRQDQVRREFHRSHRRRPPARSCAASVRRSPPTPRRGAAGTPRWTACANKVRCCGRPSARPSAYALRATSGHSGTCTGAAFAAGRGGARPRSRRRKARLFAARLIRVTEAADGIRVEYRPRGRGDVVVDRFDTVVVTTGPAHRDALRTNPVLMTLAQQGLVRPDPLGMGLLVEDHCRAVDGAGAASRSLFVTGPLVHAVTSGSSWAFPKSPRTPKRQPRSLSTDSSPLPPRVALCIGCLMPTARSGDRSARAVMSASERSGPRSASPGPTSRSTASAGPLPGGECRRASGVRPGPSGANPGAGAPGGREIAAAYPRRGVGVRPCRWTGSCCGFDRGWGVAVL